MADSTGTVLDRLQHMAINSGVAAIAKKIFLYLSTLAVLVFIATFLYGTFYYSYIPPSTYRRQVYLKKSEVVRVSDTSHRLLSPECTKHMLVLTL